MKDNIIRATAANGFIRAFVADTTNLINYAQEIHDLYPVASAALGRVITASLLLAVDMKNIENKLSVIIKGNGQLGSIVAVAKPDGKVKGYVNNPHVDLPLNNNKLDVSKGVGSSGQLTIIKDLGLKEPYSGQVDLVSGEIAEDMAYYLAVSEQKQSAVSLGVLVNPDLSIQSSGGFIIQPLPNAPEELILDIEDRLNNFKTITSLFSSGYSSKDILNELIGDMNIIYNEEIEPSYFCDCNRNRLESILLTLGKKELTDILTEDNGAELICHYCNKTYNFDTKDLEEIISIID